MAIGCLRTGTVIDIIVPSSKLSAIMYITYRPGLGNLRALDPDDTAGICAIYPPRQKPTSSGGGPVEFVTSPLSGCAVSPSRERGSAGLVWLGLALVSVLGARRVRS